TVAIKVLHQNLVHDTEFVSRFIREAQISASLNHPNIVTVYDVGSIGSVHYMAMELLEGADLHQMVKQKGALNHNDVVKWMIPVADALDYIHQKKLLHRDIKSSNILITREGRPVLMDFGIAHAAEGTKITQTGTVVGTPEYMSPEQAKGDPMDNRSDLYSLGVVMYECLTGKVPFKGDNPLTTINLLIQQIPESPNKINKEIAQWFTKLILCLLEKEPKKRISSGLLLSQSLKYNSKEKSPNQNVNMPPSNPKRIRRSKNELTKTENTKKFPISKTILFNFIIISTVSLIGLYLVNKNKKDTNLYSNNKNELTSPKTFLDSGNTPQAKSITNVPLPKELDHSDSSSNNLLNKNVPSLGNTQKRKPDTIINTAENLSYPKKETKNKIVTEKHEEQLSDIHYSKKNDTIVSSESTVSQEQQQLTPITTGTFKDNRDGKIYKWVKIGEQTWMAENLAYLPQVNKSKDNALEQPCYYIYNFEKRNVELGKASSFFTEFGVLYNYEAATRACPQGWHLPSDEEWESLIKFINNENEIFQKNEHDWDFVGHILKDSNSWPQLEVEKTLRRKDYHFRALPGGCRFNNNVFQDQEKIAYFWSSTPSNTYNTYGRYIHFKSHRFFRKRFPKDFGMSVRCVKD
ncbi:MAG: protein kinase domain-containing protein, partial [bacterium]